MHAKVNCTVAFFEIIDEKIENHQILTSSKTDALTDAFQVHVLVILKNPELLFKASNSELKTD
jgi:hypothetical protein